jgi:translation initiation factor IF-2
MTETKETTEKTLRGDAPRKPLSLKRTVESGHVRQNFSHGRSKSVVVEKKKKRTISGPGGTEGEEAAPQSEAERLLAEAMQKPGGLSTDELDARRRALEAAKERAELEEMERARLEALRPPEPGPQPEPV